MLKGSRIYTSVSEASRELLVVRMRKKIITIFIPETPLTLDPEQWSREYAADLAR